MPIDLPDDSFDTSWSVDDAKRLHAKRCQERMSMNDLSHIIGVDRSTIFKWETHKVNRCNAVHLYAIKQFMKGHYNFILRKNGLAFPTPTLIPPTLAAIMQELEKIRLRLSVLPKEYPGDRSLLNQLKYIYSWVAEKRRLGLDLD